MKPLEQLGRAAGWLVAAPSFAAAAALRRSRPLHPRGELLEGECVSVEPRHDFVPLGDALRGPVLARLSAALWKNPRSHLPDVLGCALRIGEAGREQQDLLFATIKRPWTMPFAPLTTDLDDYLANFYYAVSPFTLARIERPFYLRLRPLRAAVHAGTDRHARLVDAVQHGDVAFSIEASHRPRIGWNEVARVTLDRFANLTDDASLTFDPFHTGRGIEPRGSIHALRRGAYAAAQKTRAFVATR